MSAYPSETTESTRAQVVDFLCIGAQKAGTTSLHDWMLAEGDIALPTPKETYFFSKQEVFDRGEEWYRQRFAGTAHALRGEIDPGCLPSLWAPDRVRDAVGPLPVVAILREPLGRAYSQFLMNRARGRNQPETFAATLALEVDAAGNAGGATFAEALELSIRDADRRSAPSNRLAWTGMYSRHLERWEGAGHRAQAFLFEDLVSPERGADTYREILASIGYPGEGTGWSASAVSNAASVPRSTRVNALVFSERGRAKRALKGLVRSPAAQARLRRYVGRANSSTRTPPPMPDVSTLPLEVREAWARDIDSLETMLGLDLSRWVARLGLG